MDAFRVLHASRTPAPLVPRRPLPRRREDAEAPRIAVGVSGARQNAAVALAIDGQLVACCEQERVTRVRSEGLRAGSLPAEALQAVLGGLPQEHGQTLGFVTAEREALLPASVTHASVDHHFAHAATAALTSPFPAAAVLVCDQHGDPPVTVWAFEDGRLENVLWRWNGPGFAGIYSRCAQLFGFGPRSEHKLEALARLHTGDGFEDLRGQLGYSSGVMVAAPEWSETVAGWLRDASASHHPEQAAAAAGRFQRCLGDALVAMIEEIRDRLPYDTLCLGGGLFYNTYLNTRIVESHAFGHVFVPLNPGNPGLAAGAALARSQGDVLRPAAASPFLGPEYTNEQIKATLDNCKLNYEYLSEQEIVGTAVRALARGSLVGWFQGRMEWGHRSLGHRSILANPFSPHVLENLNAYLKQREPYRTYGLSVCEEEAPSHFHVNAPSRFMELEYRIREPRTFAHILPDGVTALRVQTLPPEAGLFRELHRAFGAVSSGGVLVNTSFNGLHEPIVCTPRDAVRVFYGTGLDLLVLGQFVIRK